MVPLIRFDVLSLFRATVISAGKVASWIAARGLTPSANSSTGALEGGWLARLPLRSVALCLGMICLLLTPCAAVPQPENTPGVVDQAQRQVVDFIGKLADLHCTEEVLQEKLRPNGGVEASARSQFDYFLYMQGSSYDFQLSESRLEVGTSKPGRAPLLLTNGFSTLLLVFHPYYRNGFEFSSGPAETIDGLSVIPVHFEHIRGTRTPAALAMRGREFPLDLKGTAWLDPSSGQVVRIDAGLLHDMSDVGLRTLNIRVDYKSLPKITDRFMLPSRAVVELSTPRQHWRNTHVFEHYKTFSIEATQDPAVKVLNKDGAVDPNAAPPSSTPNDKEQP